MCNDVVCMSIALMYGGMRNVCSGNMIDMANPSYSRQLLVIHAMQHTTECGDAWIEPPSRNLLLPVNVRHMSYAVSHLIRNIQRGRSCLSEGVQAPL